MKILLVGGTGVISTAITSEAMRQGHTIYMVNRGRRPIPEGCVLIKSDRFDYLNIAKKIGNESFDAVCDFLCYGPQQVEASFNFYKKYTKQYFFISTCEVYNHAKGLGFAEDGPKVNPIWAYSVNKWASEEKLMSIAKDSGVAYTIVRPAITYGDTRIPYGISPAYMYHWTFVERIKAGKPIITWNDGANYGNMMRVEDFATAFVPLVGNPKAYNEAFNICSDETPTFREVIKGIEDFVGKPAKLINIDAKFYAANMPERAGELLAGRAVNAKNSNQKVKSVVTGWMPKISIQEGIRMTLNAYLKQNFQKGIDWKFDAQCDRILAKWCKQNDIDATEYNLGFCDYQNKATKQQKREYWLEFNKDSFFVGLYLKITDISTRILRKLKK